MQDLYRSLQQRVCLLEPTHTSNPLRRRRDLCSLCHSFSLSFLFGDPLTGFYSAQAPLYQVTENTITYGFGFQLTSAAELEHMPVIGVKVVAALPASKDSGSTTIVFPFDPVLAITGKVRCSAG
jgi:hypothetical protein